MSSEEFRKLALGLSGTAEKPHFDRTAFFVARTFATLAGDGRSANVKFLPDEQVLQIEMAPRAFAAVSGKWGEQGWTTMQLAHVSKAVAGEALRIAWLHALPKPKKRKR